MKEQLISFETAILAKEKGFEINMALYYCSEDNPKTILYSDDSKGNIYGWDMGYDKIIPLPTQSLLQKWLREKHKICVYHDMEIETKTAPYTYKIDKFRCIIIKMINHDQSEELYTNEYLSWEEALEIGLQEALKLIEL